MFQYKIPDWDSFIVIEGIKEVEIERTYAKIIFVIKFTNKNNKILIGRARNSDVIINDYQISRFHSYLHLVSREGKTNEIWIEDLSSKFGTLVNGGNIKLINKNWSSYWIQFQNMTIQFTLKRVRNRYFCFKLKEKDLEKGFEYPQFKNLFSNTLRLILRKFYHNKKSKFDNTNLSISNELHPPNKKLDLDEWEVFSRVITDKEDDQKDEEGSLHNLISLEDHWNVKEDGLQSRKENTEKDLSQTTFRINSLIPSLNLTKNK